MPVAEGVSLAVDVWPGGGTPFLLVHGLASNRRMWDGVASVLSAAGRAVAAVDLRGHGQSDKPDWGYEFDTVVADLVALVGALGFSSPAVVGQSWGGNVVVELAFRHPGLLRGIACVDGGDIELWREFPTWEACAEKLRPPSVEGKSLADIKASIREAHPDWPETGVLGMLACYEAGPDGSGARPRLTLERHLQILRALYEHRPSALLPKLDVPVLMIPASTVAGGDHDLHAQQPDVVAGLVLERFP